MLNSAHLSRLLNHFFFGIWLVLLYITHGTINFGSAWSQGGLAFAFIVAAWLSYCGVDLLPSLLLTKLVAYLAHWKRPPQHQARTLVVYAAAIAGTGLTSLPGQHRDG